MKPLLTTALLFLASAAWAQSPARLWDATINFNGSEIPFRFEISGDGANVKGWFFNGDDREVSNSGKFENGSLVLDFDSYAAKLKATVKDGVLEGEYGPMLKKSYPIRATRAVAKPKSNGPAPAPPSVAGQWDLQGVASSKGEKAWRLILRQSGADISGAILRVDGDTGTLTGSWKDGKFVLSHFSGARPALLLITPEDDGSLALDLNGLHHEGKVFAVRQETARAKGLPEPSDPSRHT